jgi:predicted nuclease of predicted toxin-antitoxin system
MRLLLDEHFPPRIAATLRAQGFDVTCVIEQGRQQSADEEVWRQAILEERVVVTYDRDDFLALFNLFFTDGVRHPGLVIISSRTIRPNDYGTLLRSLQRLMTEDEDLSDQVVFLTR